uniref:ShKT domain-containing protein n=1 Tax=Brugia timori TaxID=42155 RepID=A0A0R3QC26_9BILA
LCFDKNINCKKEICHNYPFTAKEQCAKTCGFCSDNEGIIPPLPPSLSGISLLLTISYHIISLTH